MKISEVKIHNFRGIHDETIDICDYTLLVGPNNAGKSTVVDALRAFYEKDKFTFKKDSDFPFLKPSDEESWVEIQYLLTKEEAESLADVYLGQGDSLRVRKYFKSKDAKQNGAIFGYTDSGISPEPFYGAKNVQQGKLGDVIYIPAVSRVDDHTKLTGPSALRDLLSNILEEVVEGSESFGALTTSFHSFADGIKEEKTKESNSLTSFENEFSGLLGNWGVSFGIQIKPPSISDIVKQLLDFECRDVSHERPVRPDQFGSGFQRHFIYSLISIGPKYLAKKKAKKTKDFAPTLTLLLFEEPEAFLHPPQQAILAEKLRKLGSDDSRQVICSTHSSHFVSKNMDAISSIVRLKRTDGNVNAFQIRKPDWEDIVSENQQLHEIKGLQTTLSKDDWEEEMEAVKYCLWMNPDRASAFFANCVLLVEGPTEQSFFTRLFNEGTVQQPGEGIYVLDCMGKFNIHRFMNMLSRLGTPHAVIYDDDNEKKHHPEVHTLIDQSRHPSLTCHIERVPKDLEAFLGLESAKRPNKKPQHLMFQYSNGGISGENMKQLCGLLNRCVSSFAEPISNGAT